MVRKQLTDAVAQLIANRRPGAGDIKVANVVRHKTGARAEQRQVAAALVHQTQLIEFDRLAQFVITDFQVADFGHQDRVFDTGDLLVAPGFQRFGRGGVVAVAINDERILKAHERGFLVCKISLERCHAVALFDGTGTGRRNKGKKICCVLTLNSCSANGC